MIRGNNQQSWGRSMMNLSIAQIDGVGHLTFFVRAIRFVLLSGHIYMMRNTDHESNTTETPVQGPNQIIVHCPHNWVPYLYNY